MRPDGRCGGLASESATTHSTLACLQTDSDFAGFIISELNAGLLKDVLYLEDRGEVSFHDSFILLDPLEGRQPNPGGAGKLTLAPAQERPRSAYLRRVSHPFAVDSIRFGLTIRLL
jgi:hypothetical protein